MARDNQVRPASSATASGGAGEEDFAALFAASEEQSSPRRRIAAGDIVRGRVIAVGSATAFVEIGTKGEAVIDVNEFRDPQTREIRLAVDDAIEATVTDDGSKSGTVVLKRALGRGGHIPGELEQALEQGVPVEGLVTGENKGGFDVQLGSVHAFCPGSQMDRRRGAPAQYLGQRFPFRVIKIEAGGRNVVVSRRKLLEEEAAARATRTWEKLQVGAVLQGTVTSVREFGAFVDLGGIEGLIHVSELGHSRGRHPSEVVSEGQVLETKVIKVEPAGPEGRARIGLSLRALEPDPWSTAVDRFPVGTSLRGTVRRLEPFGAFVEICPGLDGLVHVSRIALDRRISHPRQVLNVGDEIDITVVSIDLEHRRIGLSMVEQAKRERDQQEQSVRQEAQSTVSEMNERSGLGTLSDLLAAKRDT